MQIRTNMCRLQQSARHRGGAQEPLRLLLRCSWAAVFLHPRLNFLVLEIIYKSGMWSGYIVSCYLTGIQLKNNKEILNLVITLIFFIKLVTLPRKPSLLLAKSNLLLFKIFKAPIITYPVFKTVCTSFFLW